MCLELIATRTTRMASVWWIVSIILGGGVLAVAVLLIHLVRDFRRWSRLAEKV
jgi:hypothetical protein